MRWSSCFFAGAAVQIAKRTLPDLVKSAKKGLTPLSVCGILRPLNLKTNFPCWFVLNGKGRLPCISILVLCCGRIFDVDECPAPGCNALTGHRALPLCPQKSCTRDKAIPFQQKVSLFSPGSFAKSPRFFVACNAAGTPEKRRRYRIILSADTASEVRQMLSQKHR